MGMSVQTALRKVLDGEFLTAEEAASTMSELMLGEVHHGLVGGFLIGVETRGVTGEELSGFARTMRGFARSLQFDLPNLVDTCGTGGGAPTFNLSTAAGILAAACGAKVAKHGNRAVTGQCGSADVLEAMGVPLDLPEADQKRRLEEVGFAFMFAPSHHPAVRHVAPVRKALGVRTFFNLLGPLANPAGARRQMIGVYSDRALRPVADALNQLGVDHAVVVHGHDGMDEVSPCAPTRYVQLHRGQITEGEWQLSDFGQEALTLNQIQSAGGVPGHVESLRRALTDADSPEARAIVPNTAVTLMLADLASSVAEGAELARAALKAGAAAQTLARLIESEGA